MNQIVSLKDRLSSEQKILLTRLFGDLKIEVISAALWQADGEWGFPERSLDHVFLILSKEGGFEGMAGGRGKQKVVPGQGMLIPPGVPHALHSLKPEKETLNLAFHFRLLGPLGLPIRDFFPAHFFELSEGGYWIRTLEQWTALAEEKKSLLPVWGEGLLKSFLADLSGQGETLAFLTPQLDRRLLIPLKKIHEGFGEALDVKTLAGLAELSEEHFRKVFLKDLGVSPKEYIASYRMEKSAEFLRSTEMRITEVARRSGFSYDHYFHLCFKKHFGVTPSEYRRLTPI
ncbi:MAG: helix-turn-helix domain-containing protein [Spirochaetia bacterium]|nr:helix-turn-helix domain-containing protein [Spirochaetia bacterium]